MNKDNAGHMINIAAMPIYGKNTKHLLSVNICTDFDKSLYEASGT